MLKRLLFIVLLLHVVILAKAHSVQVVYCGSCQGELTLWVEHWHGGASPGSTTMDLDLTINGVTTRISGSPDINLQNTALADLPNCSTPPTHVSKCNGKANTYNDWVRYTFPQVPCGTNVSIRIISGNTAFTADCGGMYPVSTGTFQIPCPTPPTQFSDQEGCANDVIMSIPFPNSNQPGVNYEWSNNNPAIGLPTAGNGDIPSFNTPASTTTEVATINVTQGCNQSQFNITVHPQPQPNFSVTNNSNLNPTGAPITTCLYDPIYFQSQSGISAGNIQSMVWDFGENGATSTQNVASHQYASDGVFNVTLTAESNNGCIDDITLPVTVHPIPVASLVGPPACQYDLVQFEDMSTVNAPDYISENITNFGDNSPNSQDLNPSHAYNTDGTFNVEYIVVSNNGCIDTTSIDVIIYPVAPIPLPDQEGCANDLVTILPFPPPHQPGGYEWINYNPNVGLATTGVGDVPSFNANPSTILEVLTIQVKQGCSNSQFNITVHPQPQPDFSVTNNTNLNPTGAPITTCLYDSIYFQDQSIVSSGSIQSAHWDFGENGITSNLQNPAHKYSQDGSFDVTLTSTTNKGCVNLITKPIIVNPVPRAHLLESPVCQYDSVQFEDSSSINSPDYVDQTILDFGDGSPIVQDINPQHQYPAHGIYNVNYIVISNNGCIDNTSITTEIYPVPIANYSFTTVCENGDPSAFYNASTVSPGSIMGWQWDFDEAINGVSTLPNPQHDYEEDGIYNVKLVVNTDKGCFDTIVQPVKVLAKPIAVLTSNITESCADACIDFYDVSLSNATSINYWKWTLGEDDIIYEQNPTKCYYNSSNTEDSLFTIGLKVRNDLGCYDSVYAVDYIAAWHNPIAEFNTLPDLTNIYLSTIELANNSIGADFYDWTFGEGSYSFDFEPQHTYLDTGYYNIQLVSETTHGCKDTLVKTVRIDPLVSLYVPNTFTPNGDGVNDYFFFKEYAIEEEGVDFKIFDKWGTLIYYTDGFNPWDGTYKGELVKQDTYVYKITCFDFFGIEHNKKGHVNLLR